MHWKVNVPLKGSADGVSYRLGMGNTGPNDTCSQFAPSLYPMMLKIPMAISTSPIR